MKALDGLTLFNLVMITLVELGAVFWVGAQLWFVFVLQPATEDHKEESTINQRVQERFERRFSPPVLLVLLFANVGVLVGQALNINAAAVSPAVVASLATSGRFGTFWMMREIVIVVALLLSLYMLFVKQRPRFVDKMFAWGNLILGLALLIAISMSSQAAGPQQEHRDLRYSNRLATPAGGRIVGRRSDDDRDNLPADHRSGLHCRTHAFTANNPTLLYTMGFRWGGAPGGDRLVQRDVSL